jgi:hypothetical protein
MGLKKTSVNLIAGFAYLSSWRADVPARPSKVPSGAHWLGGVDGGVWIKCVPSSSEKVIRCAVFQAEMGDILVEEDFFSEKPLPQLAGSKDFYESLIYYDADGVHAKGTIYRVRNGEQPGTERD